MIAGIFHEGSGIGNQLHRYVGTRVAALDAKNVHGMIAPELFKASGFMNLEIGETNLDYEIEYPAGKVVVAQPKDVTILDAEFQGEKYFMHRLDEVRKWLKVEPMKMSDDICVIGFRGGEYAGVKDLFLPKTYWDMAISMMPGKTFEVHTDDPDLAAEFFPDYYIVGDPEINWRSVRYAKHLIIANSSFYILPALLGDAKKIIAPKYWAGYNKRVWQLEENQYKKFTYIHHENL